MAGYGIDGDASSKISVRTSVGNLAIARGDSLGRLVTTGDVPRTAANTVTAVGNVAGLTAELDLEGYSTVSVWAEAGAAATVTFEVSLDGVTWREHTIVLNAAAGIAVLDVLCGFRHVRLTSPTTGVELTFEIAAKA